MLRQRRRAYRPALDRLDDRCLLSGLTPAQVKHAYGLDALTFTQGGQTIRGDGNGQTIAIVDAEHDPYLASDLHAFDQAFGLPDTSLDQINLAGARTDDGWAQEEALDVEWAHAMAPGANLVVVEARSTSTKDMMAAVDAARGQPGVSVVSMSWSMPETSGQTTTDRHFTSPAGHIGITFVASSGDSGPAGGAQWPAASSRVVAVGGTSLLVDASGNVLGESAWSGSSGGFSRFEAEPADQARVQGTGRRSTPDVAFDADPATGVAVFWTAPSTGIGSWIVVGGTSIGAPAWAGILAIVDQGRAGAGLGTLDGGTQTVPALYRIPSSDFRTVSNGTVVSTGRGSPAGAALINDLAFGNTTPSSATVAGQVAARKVAARASHRHAHAHVQTQVHSDLQVIDPLRVTDRRHALGR
jgi:subtilase family serine protease